MTSLITRPARVVVPVFSRESIRWRGLDPETVEIEIEVDNPESEPTAPGDLVLETAGLGAFVPFRPVTRVALGSLEPGERRRVQARVARARLAPPAAVPQSFGSVMANALRDLAQ